MQNKVKHAADQLMSAMIMMVMMSAKLIVNVKYYTLHKDKEYEGEDDDNDGDDNNDDDDDEEEEEEQDEEKEEEEEEDSDTLQ